VFGTVAVIDPDADEPLVDPPDGGVEVPEIVPVKNSKL
jgi:hypothetical protein